MKDHQAGLHWKHGRAPEHISLQAKYLGALRTIEGTAIAECRARCQAAEAFFAPFYAVKFFQQFQGACVQGSDCGRPVGSTRDSTSRCL